MSSCAIRCRYGYASRCWRRCSRKLVISEFLKLINVFSPSKSEEVEDICHRFVCFQNTMSPSVWVQAGPLLRCCAENSPSHASTLLFFSRSTHASALSCSAATVVDLYQFASQFSYFLTKISQSNSSSMKIFIISSHLGLGTVLLISASCNCSQRELRTPPLLSVIIPHTLAFAVRQEVFLSSDEGVLSSSSLSHSLLPPLPPTLFLPIHFSSAVVLMQH